MVKNEGKKTENNINSFQINNDDVRQNNHGKGTILNTQWEIDE